MNFLREALENGHKECGFFSIISKVLSSSIAYCINNFTPEIVPLPLPVKRQFIVVDAEFLVYDGGSSTIAIETYLICSNNSG